ncbi:MAG: hypothetical protein Q6K55_02680 [Thermostichus sp. DG02_3_bins_51]
MLPSSAQVNVSDMVARLQAGLDGHLQVQARLSGHRLLVRIEGDPLPEPDRLLEHLAPTLEAIAAVYGQRRVEIFAFPATEAIPEWHRQWEGQVQLNPDGPLYRAKQGDVEAIHYLLNYLLRREGIQARIHLNRKLGLLQVNLQAAEAPDPTWAKDFMRRTLARLELIFLQQLRLSGQKLGSFFPTWSQEFDLKEASFWQAPPVRPPLRQDIPNSGLGENRQLPLTQAPESEAKESKAQPEPPSKTVVQGWENNPETHPSSPLH